MTKFFSSDDEVGRIAASLSDLTLPKAQWTHAAHFAAALWLLRHHEPPIARRMPELIRAYNLATGAANTDTSGYHETITLASLGAARSVLDGRPPVEPLHEVLDLLMASPLGDPRWLLDHWTKDRLFSTEARRRWLDPDLQPLPFAL